MNYLIKFLNSSTIEEIDFAELYDIDSDKVSRSHYYVGVSEAFKAKFKSLDSGLKLFNGHFRYFNGKFWDLIDKRNLKSILGEYAYECGVPEVTSKLPDFRSKLLETLEGLVENVIDLPDKTITRVNLENGTIEIKRDSIEKVKFNKNHYLKYCLNFNYDEHAECHKFYAFLNQVLPEDDKKMVLSEFFGSVFDLSIKHEKILLMQGTGANGKSVLQDIMRAVIGEENICSSSLQNLTDSKGLYRTELAKNLLNMSSELSGSLDSAAFKQLASGEPINARLLYGQPYTITNYARLAFNCNKLPAKVEHTHGFFRRIHLVPFNVTISDEEQDFNLAANIIENELPGIFNWLIEGLKRLRNQNGKFSPCESCNAASRRFKTASNSVALYIENRYEIDGFNEVPLKVLFDAYNKFCTEYNYKPVTHNNFRNRLENLGFTSKRKANGYIIYCISITK